jgi:starvation-inducible outer membrane lipoprotein
MGTSTLGQIQSSYSGTAWTQNTNYLNMTTQGIQRWTVPETKSYKITVAGAAGGTMNYFGGYGRIMRK